MILAVVIQHLKLCGIRQKLIKNHDKWKIAFNMAKTKQNRVPPEFESFYNPMLQLKQALQSNKAVLDAGQSQTLVHGLMVLHYATFVLCSLYKITDNKDNTAALLIRTLAENILEVDNFELDSRNISRVVSFIDSVGKYLNTTEFAKLHVAMYHGYLDYEIYYNLHKNLRLYDFKWCCTIEPETVARMKEYYNASAALLKQLNQQYL